LKRGFFLFLLDQYRVPKLLIGGLVRCHLVGGGLVGCCFFGGLVGCCFFGGLVGCCFFGGLVGCCFFGGLVGCCFCCRPLSGYLDIPLCHDIADVAGGERVVRVRWRN
jgi:hypothetical protein